MAEKTVLTTLLEYEGTSYAARLVTWNALAAGDKGAWVKLPGTIRSVEGYSAAWGASTLTWEGTNLEDPVLASTGTPLTSAGSAISQTANGQAAQVAQLLRWIRPALTGGTGSITPILYGA